MTHRRFLFSLMMINGDMCASLITSLDVLSGQCFTRGPPMRKLRKPPPQYRRPHFGQRRPKRCPGVSHLVQTGCSWTIR
jgi:hypothetical protein